MDGKQQRGTIFDAVGTSAIATAIAVQGLSGGTTIYITDISGCSIAGTATVRLRAVGGDYIWEALTLANECYSIQLKQPIGLTATAELVVEGAAAASYKSANIAGYII